MNGQGDEKDGEKSAQTTGRIVISQADYDGEIAVTSLRATVLTASNFNAQALLRQEFRDTLTNISLGTRRLMSYRNDVLYTLDSASADAAQIELKWLVTYHDNTTLRRYNFSIPCAETVHLDSVKRGFAAIGDKYHVDAFVAATEAYILSPEGNPITIENIRLVGRRV